MNRILQVAQSASVEAGVQFRQNAYTAAETRNFLRDVLALANAPVDGPRYIVVGAEIDVHGRKQTNGVQREDFAKKPTYGALVAEYIEPPIRLRYQPVALDGKNVGVFEIADCQDKPYMMRVDHCERLRRGDAYVRLNNAPIKMGRRQLQALFERKFRDSVSADQLEVGFPGEIIHKEYEVRSSDLSDLPSAVAGSKLRQLMEVQESSKNSGSTTVMARMMHARLFGSDMPYENKSADELLRELSDIERDHVDADHYFMFEQRAQKVQMVVYNQGDDAIEDASLVLTLPNHDDFHVAHRLPKLPDRNGLYVDRGPAEFDVYPIVNANAKVTQISTNLGRIPANALVDVFDTPLRVCASSALTQKTISIRFALHGRNLRTPANGKLLLKF